MKPFAKTYNKLHLIYSSSDAIKAMYFSGNQMCSFLLLSVEKMLYLGPNIIYKEQVYTEMLPLQSGTVVKAIFTVDLTKKLIKYKEIKKILLKTV